MASNIEFTEKLTLGLTDIDEQHRELVEKLNAIMPLIENNSSINEWTQDLDAFIAAAAQHFRDEETVMRNIRYPRYYEHKASHEALVRELTAYRAELTSKDDPTLPHQVVSYLRMWLLKHLVLEDSTIRTHVYRNFGEQDD